MNISSNFCGDCTTDGQSSQNQTEVDVSDLKHHEQKKADVEPDIKLDIKEIVLTVYGGTSFDNLFRHFKVNGREVLALSTHDAVKLTHLISALNTDKFDSIDTKFDHW